jgi:hypothetical protein
VHEQDRRSSLTTSQDRQERNALVITPECFEPCVKLAKGPKRLCLALRQLTLQVAPTFPLTGRELPHLAQSFNSAYGSFPGFFARSRALGKNRNGSN